MRDLDAVLEVADVVQIGARNMQNYPLLAEVGRSGRPALLKRGLSATLDELLMAAEYILKEGNPNVMLCERGIRTFETAYRFTLDLMAVPVLKELSHLPVIVDPSHAAGRRDLVHAAVARGRRRRRGRDHRRGAPQPRRGDLRRPAGAARRRRSPSTRARSSRPPRSPARRSAPSDAAAGRCCGRTRASRQRETRLEGRGPRRRPDRRLDRTGRARGVRARRSAATTPTPRVRARALALGAIDTQAQPTSPRRSTAPTWCSSPRRVGALRRDRARRARGAGPDCVVSDVGSTKRALARPPRRRALRRRPSAGRRRDRRRRARPRGPVRRRHLVSDARRPGTAGRPVRAPAPAARRASARSPRRSTPTPRPPDGVRLASAARARQPARRAGRARSPARRAARSCLPAVGPSFRDATRVAGANSAIWTDIYLSNRDALIAAIDELDRAPRRGARSARRRATPTASPPGTSGARADREALLGAGLVGGRRRVPRAARLRAQPARA